MNLDADTIELPDESHEDVEDPKNDPVDEPTTTGQNITLEGEE